MLLPAHIAKSYAITGYSCCRPYTSVIRGGVERFILSLTYRRLRVTSNPVTLPGRTVTHGKIGSNLKVLRPAKTTAVTGQKRVIG